MATQQSLRDNETIWRDTIAKDPKSWMAHNNLATILFDRGEMLEAIEHHTAALRVKPDDAPAHNELG